jgi:hypothetical protein
MNPAIQKARRRIQRFVRFYPPFLGAGVRVNHIDEEFRTIEVHMPLRFWNKNYVGTHFGGSLYTMCDPFFMLILLNHLGPDYIVWDKAATIRFRRPGKGLVKAVFAVPGERIEEIRAQADALGRIEPQFQTVVTDMEGNVVAEVDKLLYVKKKRPQTKLEPIS